VWSACGSIGIAQPNLPPVANAGPDQSVWAGATVALSAGGSTDPDDGIASYLWRQLSGSSVALSDAGSALASFAAPAIGAGSVSLIFEVKVADHHGLATSDTIVVTVTALPLDSDHDGIPDALDPDDDNDGMPDAWEIAHGLNPLVNDAAGDIDGNGIPNGVEYTLAVNSSPGVPAQPQGPASGLLATAYAFSTAAVDPDGQPLVYRYDWGDGAVSQWGAAGQSHSWSAIGQYCVKAQARDSLGALSVWSECGSIGIAAPNLPPVANAGPDQTVAEGAPVVLNGSHSYDPNDSIVSFQWSQTGGPPVQLFFGNTVQAHFSTPDVSSAGVALTFQLEVADGHGERSVDSVIVNVTWDNQPPLADAGTNLIVKKGARVSLDATGSRDTDGILAYQWRQLSGPAVLLTGADTAKPEVDTATMALEEASLIFELTVTDTGGLKATDSVILNVLSNNLPPVAHVGSDQVVPAGRVVTLNGLNSWDPEGALAFFAWSQIAGHPVTLSDSTAACPTFTAPDLEGEGAPLVFVLTVTDAAGLKGSARTMVNVARSNSPPVAVISIFQPAGDRYRIHLKSDGSYDPDGFIARQMWRQLGGPKVTLSDPAAVQTSFGLGGLPDACTRFEFELTVEDDAGLQNRITKSFTVCEGSLSTTIPIINRLTVREGETVQLKGWDPKYAKLKSTTASPRWEQIAGPTVVLSDPADWDPTFVAPARRNPPVEIIFQLSIADQIHGASFSQFAVWVTSNGQSPWIDGVAELDLPDQKHLLARTDGDSALVKFLRLEPLPISDDEGRLLNLPYGLVDLSARVARAGESVEVRISLPEPAPLGAEWLVWENSRGWSPDDSIAGFSPDRRQIILYLTDGGPGDANDTVDGLIESRSTMGLPKTTSSYGEVAAGSSHGGRDGVGCFINTLLSN
jgi:hypothetical protein